jgi:uncharacterized membrane protein
LNGPGPPRKPGGVKSFRAFFTDAVVSGLLVVVPLYLTGLLLWKLIQTLRRALEPVEELLPDLIFGEYLLAALILLLLTFLVGVALQTSVGRGISAWFQDKVFARIPGYSLFQGLTRQFTGNRDEKQWKPALAEIEEALVPAFIIEELDDGSFTVFVPSVPTPLAGTVYILEPARVHKIDISFSQAALVVARWGAGAKDLIAAMNRK